MHCKNTKSLRQLINQHNKIHSSQQKNNVLRLYRRDLSILNPILIPIFIPKNSPSISKDETVNLYPLCVVVVGLWAVCKLANGDADGQGKMKGTTVDFG